MRRIAFLGLGAMGRRMADKLVDKQYELAVFNRSADPTTTLAKRGATVAATPREAAADADVVISMVTDDAASRSVWLDASNGAALSLKPNAVAIECSTVTPGWIAELGAALDRTTASLLDAPVVGTRPQADAAQLVFLVGGPAAVVERVKPLVTHMGSAVHHIGPRGSGALMKLAVNALFGIQVAALGEVLGLLTRGGLELGAAVEVLSSMAVTSPALRGVGALIAAGKFDPMFPIDLVEKDFGYVVQAAEANGAQVPTSSAVRDVYRQAIEAGHGQDNIAGVAQLFG